jgi:hypothetical protein
MRVLLRHTKTGLFYMEPSGWTDQMEKAEDFKHSATAILYAHQVGLEDVEALLSFGDPDLDVVLPFGPRSPRVPSGQ